MPHASQPGIFCKRLHNEDHTHTQSVCANVGVCRNVRLSIIFLGCIAVCHKDWTFDWTWENFCRFFWNPASLPASLEELYVEVHRVCRTYRFLTFSSSVRCAEVAGSECWRYTYSWRSQVESARDGRHSVYKFVRASVYWTDRDILRVKRCIWRSPPWRTTFSLLLLRRPRQAFMNSTTSFPTPWTTWCWRRGPTDGFTSPKSPASTEGRGRVGWCLRIWPIRLFPSPTFFQVRREKKGKQSLLAQRYGKLTRNGCQKQNHNVYTQHASCVPWLKLISQTMVAIDLSWLLYRCFVTFANQVQVTPFVLWIRTSNTRKMKVDLLSQTLLKSSKKVRVQIKFSSLFSSDKDRRTDSRIGRKITAQPRRESNPGSCEF